MVWYAERAQSNSCRNLVQLSTLFPQKNKNAEKIPTRNQEVYKDRPTNKLDWNILISTHDTSKRRGIILFNFAKKNKEIRIVSHQVVLH